MARTRQCPSRRRLCGGEAAIALCGLAVLLGAGVRPAGSCSINGGQLTRTFERIREELPPGMAIGVLNFDSPSNVSGLRVVRGNRYFELNVSTYSILVKERLDVDDSAGGADADQQPLSMQVRCTNKQGVEFDIELWFHIEDVNDNRPYFVPSGFYTFNVSETTALAMEIGHVLARDNDRDNLAIEYSLVESEHSAYFSLRDKPGGSAALTLAVSLDFEKSQQMSVLILATDCPHSGCQLPLDRKTATATVTINVVDADDQNPEFMGTPYEVFLSDSARDGAVVIQARARDLDTLNAPLRYEMSSYNDAMARAAYHIDSLTGVVTVKNASLLQAGQLHLLQIRVYQLNDHSRRDSTTVVIRVVARDVSSLDGGSSLAVQFDQRSYVAQVAEATPPGTAILMLVVNDLDPGRSLRFSIRNQPSEDMFRIANRRYSTGVLYLKRYLDYESRSQYELVVEVSNGVAVDTAAVTVMVVDVNDNNPEFKQEHYEFRVMMPSAAAVGGTVCGSVSASDKDAGSNITYKLGSSYRELFGITSSGSIVLTGGAADYRADVYYLTVLATDNGSPPRTGVTTVSIYVARSSSSAAMNAAAKAPQQEDGAGGYVVYIVAGIAAILLVIVIALTLYLARRRVKDAAKRMCTSPVGSTMAVEDGSHHPDKIAQEQCLKKPHTNGFAGQPTHVISPDKAEKQQQQNIPLLPLKPDVTSNLPTAATDRSSTLKRNSCRADTKPGDPTHAPTPDAATHRPTPPPPPSELGSRFSDAPEGSSTYTMRSKSPGGGAPYTNLIYTRNGLTGVSVLYEEEERQQQFAQLPPPPSPLQCPTDEDRLTSAATSARRRLLPALSKGASTDSSSADDVGGASASSRDERGSADGDALSGLAPLDGTPTLPKRRITWDRTVYVADDDDDDDLGACSTRKLLSQAAASPASPGASADDNGGLLISPPPSASSRQKLIINL